MAATDTASSSHKQQDQSQGANPNALSPSTANAEPPSFEATTAVLDTNELLHLIISAVTREHRTSLRRVSKNWQAAVLNIGHVFEPIYHNWYLHDSAAEKGFYGLGPTYTLENGFALNPTTWSGSRTHDSVDPDYELSYLLYFAKNLSLAELTRRKREFITDPPLSQVMIHAGRFECEESQVAVLRVRGGIRIGDLLEYFGKLNYMAPTFSRSASFAVRYYNDESSEGGDHGEDESGDEEGDGEAEVEIGGEAGNGEIEVGQVGQR
jgi:hypothetical protein